MALSDYEKQHFLRVAELYVNYANSDTYSPRAREFWLERSWLILLAWASGEEI